MLSTHRQKQLFETVSTSQPIAADNTDFVSKWSLEVEIVLSTFVGGRAS